MLVYQYFTPPRCSSYAQDPQYQSHSCGWTRMVAVWIGMAVMFITNMTMLQRLTFVLSTIGIFLFTGNRTALLHWETVYNDYFMVRNNDNFV